MVQHSFKKAGVLALTVLLCSMTAEASASGRGKYSGRRHGHHHDRYHHHRHYHGCGHHVYHHRPVHYHRDHYPRGKSVIISSPGIKVILGKDKHYSHSRLAALPPHCYPKIIRGKTFYTSGDGVYYKSTGRDYVRAEPHEYNH